MISQYKVFKILGNIYPTKSERPWGATPNINNAVWNVRKRFPNATKEEIAQIRYFTQEWLKENWDVQIKN